MCRVCLDERLSRFNCSELEFLNRTIPSHNLRAWRRNLNSVWTHIWFTLKHLLDVGSRVFGGLCRGLLCLWCISSTSWLCMCWLAFKTHSRMFTYVLVFVFSMGWSWRWYKHPILWNWGSEGRFCEVHLQVFLTSLNASDCMLFVEYAVRFRTLETCA